MTRFISCLPDETQGLCWLVLAKAPVEPGPGGGPVFVTESQHPTYAEAATALATAPLSNPSTGAHP